MGMTKDIRQNLSELADNIQIQVTRLELVEAQRQRFLAEAANALGHVGPYESYDDVLGDIQEVMIAYDTLRRRSPTTMVLNEPLGPRPIRRG
jgi:hypothetical protein